MKRLLILLLALPLSGCLMELLTVTAIQGELAAENATASMRALDQAKEQRATIELRSGIDAYAAEHGYYPASLTVLVPEYLASIPTHPDGSAYGYDPATGRVMDAPAAVAAEIPFTTRDEENLAALEDAIYMYWEATGYYPSELSDLGPIYIKKVPRLSSGGEFVYKPKTGAVFHPAELIQPAGSPYSGTQGGSARGSVGGGAGSLGQVTTSIGIQNQLNSMNQSGAARARGAGQGNLGRTTDDYNRRQMEAVRELENQ